MKSFIGATACLLCLAQWSCDGATHEVGPGGSLNAQAIVAGDTVLLQDGVYAKFPPLVSGTAKAPVTYRAANPGQVIVDTTNRGEKPGLPFDSLAGTGLVIDGAKHLRFAGFVLRNCRMGIQLEGGAEDVTCEDLEITGARLGIRVEAAQNFTFRRLRIHHNAKGVYLGPSGAHHGLFEAVTSELNDDGKGRGGDGDGFQMKPEVHHLTFLNCIARGNSEDGIDVKGAHCVIDGCVLAQNGGTALKSWNQGTRVRNTLAWGNTRGFAFGNFYPLRSNVPVASASLVNCTSAANKNENLSLGPDLALEFRANVIASLGTGVAVTYAIKVDEKSLKKPLRLAAFLPELNDAQPAPANLKSQNLVWATDPKELVVVGAEKKKLTAADLQAGHWEAKYEGVSFLVEDPGFVDPAKGDFHLKPGSKAQTEKLGAPTEALNPIRNGH